MVRVRLLVVVLSFFCASLTLAQEPNKEVAPAKTSNATFLITGLHCRPCTSTLQASLAKVKGIKSAKVNWETRNARLEFDEGVITAQGVASAITNTPHMMGRGMQYGGWLALSVPDFGDESVAKKASEALGKVKGVTKVVPYPKQKAVGIAFGQGGAVSSKELIDALATIHVKASNY